MGQSSSSSVYLSELRVARSLTADLSSKKIFKSTVSAAAALFMLVSPFYLGGLGRIWSAFGVSFR